MQIPQYIKESSYSDTELVLPYMEAMDVIALAKEMGMRVLGWEGVILYKDGQLGGSLRHQGTSDFSKLSNLAAAMLASSTIMQSNEEWRILPEHEDAELLFSISLET
jgi:hypothetical protein